MFRHPLFAVTLATLVAVSVVSSAASAQGQLARLRVDSACQNIVPGGKSVAAPLFKRALDLLQLAGRPLQITHPEACREAMPLMQQSSCHFQGTGLDYWRGQCSERLTQGKATALELYRRCEAIARNAGDAADEKRCKEAGDALEGELPLLTIDFGERVWKLPGVHVEVDGIPVEPVSATTSVHVDLGKHLIVVSAPRRQAVRQAIDVRTPSHLESVSDLPDPTRCDELYWQGFDRLAQGRPAEVCSKDPAQSAGILEESAKLCPRAETKLLLARCFRAVGRYASAASTFRDAARFADAEKQEANAATARQAANDSEALAGRLRITPPPGTEDGWVNVGKAVWPQGNWGTDVPVDPSQYVVYVRRPGCNDLVQTVDIVQQGSVELSVEACSTPGWVWAVAGAGLVSAGAAVVATADAMSAQGQIDDECGSDRACTDSVFLADVNGRLDRDAVLTTIFSLGAAAGIGIAAYGWIDANRPFSSKAAVQGVVVAPLATPRAGGVLLSGTF
jgi:hypothetical protein